MNFICKICEKVFDNYRALNAHQAVHKVNHTEVIVKQKNGRNNSYSEKEKNKREDYLNNTKKCLFCNNNLSYKRRKKQTCSYVCAAKLRNSKRQLISINLICEKCNKEYIRNIKNIKRINHICQECRSHISYIKHVKPKIACKVCGEYNCKSKICEYYYNNGDITLKRLGLNNQNIGTKEFLTDIEKLLFCILEEYEYGNISSTDLLEKYNVGYATFLRLCSMVKIKIKSKSEAGIIAYKRGKQPGFNTRFKTEWHTTWMGNKVFLRSGEEIKYAQKLDEQKIVYEVESKRFKYISLDSREHVYIPDFYLPNENKIVEIKGSYFYEKNKELIDIKIETVKKYGYNVELIVC